MLFTEPEGPSRWGRVVWALRCPMWLFAPTLRCPMWPTPVLECPGPVSMLGRLSICEWTDSCPQAATKFLSPMGAWGPASLDEWHSAWFTCPTVALPGQRAQGGVTPGKQRRPCTGGRLGISGPGSVTRAHLSLGSLVWGGG